MLYNATVQQPSATLGAIASPSEPGTLILNKLNRLETRKVQQDGTLKRINSVLLHGSIAALAAVPSASAPADDAALVLLTTNMRLIVLDPVSLRTLASISLSERHARPARNVSIVVDPLRRLVLVHAYDGLARIIQIKKSQATPSRRRSSAAAGSAPDREEGPLQLSRSFNVRLPALNVDSLALLALGSPDAADGGPLLLSAVLTDHSQQRVLRTFVVRLAERELTPANAASPLPEQLSLADPGAEMLVPVQRSDGTSSGVLVVGEEYIVHYSLDSTPRSPQPSLSAASKGKGKRRSSSSAIAADVNVQQPLHQPVSCQLPVALITASTAMQDVPGTFILGDMYGKLFLVRLHRSDAAVESIIIEDLGDASSPTALVYLPAAASDVSRPLLFIASRFTDSQLVAVSPSLFDPDGDTAMADSGDVLELTDSLTSLAPIHDFALLDADAAKTGVSEVVTCSGAYAGGSLRIVRQGVGFREHARFDIAGARGLWRVPPTAASNGLSVLALGLMDSTRCLAFSAGSGEDEDAALEEVELPAIQHDVPSVHVARVGDLLVQVTRNAVNVATAGPIWSGSRGSQITIAATLGDSLLTALQGGQLQLFHAENGQLVQQASTTLAQEASCVHLTRVGDRALAIVGTWGSQSISVFDLPSLSQVAQISVDSAYPVRSAHVQQVDEHIATLLVGLGDGSFVSSSLERSLSNAGSELAISAHSVGTRPVSFSNAGRNGLTVALSDRLSIVAHQTGHSHSYLSVSALNVQDGVAACEFDDPLFPHSLAVATPDCVLVGTVDMSERLDVRTVPLNEDEPKRICKASSSASVTDDLLGIIAVRRLLDRGTGEQTMQSVVRFFSRETFADLGSSTLDVTEDDFTAICSIAPNAGSARFIVGTKATKPNNDATAASPGQLLLVDFDRNRGNIVVRSHLKVSDCVYEVVDMGNGLVAAAVGSQVLVAEASGESLVVKANWTGAFVAYTLARRDDELIIGDALRSMALLRLARSPVVRLEEVARDYSSRYMLAVSPLTAATSSSLGDRTGDFVGAESDLNLFTTIKEDVSTDRSMADEFLLAPRGAFHLGQLVTRLRAGAFAYGQTESNAAQPRVIYTTSAGAIGILAELSLDLSKLLSELERNMAKTDESASLGHLSQPEWRAWKSEHRTTPAAGFVDGDFVESFTSLSPDAIATVLAGTSEPERIEAPVTQVNKVLGDLARLH